jgi:hypothetical protein
VKPNKSLGGVLRLIALCVERNIVHVSCKGSETPHVEESERKTRRKDEQEKQETKEVREEE